MSDEQDDLRWHALNYRTAAPQHAHAMWEELEACVARKVAAERERFVLALRVARGALLQCTPCAAPDCAVEQRDWLDTAAAEIDRALSCSNQAT